MTRHARLILLLAALGGGFSRPVWGDGVSAAASPAVAATNAAPRVRALGEDEVTRLLTAALQRQFVGSGGELDLRLTQPWTSPEVPAGPLTLKVLDMPNNGVASSFIVRFEILAADGRSLGDWQCPVQAHVWREIWVARSMLNPGELVADADVAAERRDVLAVHAPLADFAAGDTALEIAQSVPAGSPLLAYEVRLHPVIRRGQITDALIRDGRLSVTVKAQALEDGAPGQFIRLRNLNSAHDFSGQVLNGKTVIVPL